MTTHIYNNKVIGPHSPFDTLKVTSYIVSCCILVCKKIDIIFRKSRPSRVNKKIIKASCVPDRILQGRYATLKLSHANNKPIPISNRSGCATCYWRLKYRSPAKKPSKPFLPFLNLNILRGHRRNPFYTNNRLRKGECQIHFFFVGIFTL